MTKTPPELTNGQLEKALIDLNERIELTTDLKSKNSSVFSDKQIAEMHYNFTSLKESVIKELKFRGVYKLIKK